MPAERSGFQNRREFFRLKFQTPVRFRTFPFHQKSSDAASQNISSSGVLFKTPQAPMVSSIVWMSVDLRTLRICQEIEERALVVRDGILGRIVRVEEDTAKGTATSYNVGVQFLTREERETRDVRRALAELES